ncbi:MAG: hypothetical protein ACRCXT_03330, partial [Paraclostridium sp.]
RELRRSFNMIKSILNIIKMFKGVKGIVLLKCDSCNSINISFDKETLSEEYIERDGKKFKFVNYNVNCNSCNSPGYVSEMWVVDKVCNEDL